MPLAPVSTPLGPMTWMPSGSRTLMREWKHTLPASWAWKTSSVSANAMFSPGCPGTAVVM